MKIIPKDRTQNFSLPLPIYRSIHLADAISRDGEEFNVFIGLEKKIVDQLKKLSLDKSDFELQNSTGDRARFGEGSYVEWYEKGRTPFCLIHKRTDVLASLVWFSPKPINESGLDSKNDNWHAVSCRSYPPFRSKGNMKNFTKYAMDIYKDKFPDTKFWAAMDDRNKIARRLFSSLSFEIDEKNSDLDDNWLIVTK